MIRVWDLISGQELSRLAGFNQSLATVYLGQDQHTVITSEIVWKTKTGTTWICDLQDPTKRKEHSGLVLLDVHDQSQVAALVDESGTVSVRSVPSLELISVLPEPQLKTTCGKFSRSGEQLATGNAFGTTVLSRLSELKCEKLARHDPVPDVVTDVVFSINGRFLIETNGKGVVQIWDTSTRSVQKVIKTSVDEAWSLAASPDGKWLAVGCIDGQIELFSMPEIGKLRGISRRWPQSNLCCAIDPRTENYAVLESGPTIRIYSSDDDSEVKTLPLNPDFVWEQIAYSNDGRSLWVGDNGGRISKLDVASGETQQSTSTYELPIAPLVVSRDDRFLGVRTQNAVIESGVVRSGIWDAQSGKEIFRLPMKINENTQVLHHVIAIVNNSEAITVQDNLAMRFDFRTGKELLPRFEDRKGWIFMASQVPHSESVLIGLRDSTVIIWDTRNNKITHEFSGLNSTLSAIAFTKEGETLVTATYSGEIRLWDLTTGLQICELFGAGGEINHVWFSEAEHRLLAFVKSQGSSQVIHWDAR
jgi:WD40 repeat protein